MKAPSTRFQHQIMAGDGVATGFVMTPPRARLRPVGFVLGTHDFYQAVKPAKTLGHFRMKIQQNFVVRRQACILRDN